MVKKLPYLPNEPLLTEAMIWLMVATGDAGKAESILLRVLQESGPRLGQTRRAQSRRVLLLAQAWKIFAAEHQATPPPVETLKEGALVAADDWSRSAGPLDWKPRWEKLGNFQRGLLALWFLHDGESAELSAILGLNTAQTRSALADSRLQFWNSFVPENTPAASAAASQFAGEISALPWVTDKENKNLHRTAEQKAAGRAEFHSILASQLAFDRRADGALEQLRMPEGVSTRLQNALASEGTRGPARRRIGPVPAVIAAVVVLFGVGLLLWLEKKDQFPGRESIEDLAALSPVEAEIEAFDGPASGLTDLLFLRHGLENFVIAEPLGSQNVEGFQVEEWDGRPLVRVTMATGGRQLLMFQTADMEFELPGKNSEAWQVIRSRKGPMGLREQSEVCTLVLPGSESDMLADLETSLP